MPAPFLLRRPASAPYFHSLLKIFQIPPTGKVIKIYSTLLLKEGGDPNYVRSRGMVLLQQKSMIKYNLRDLSPLKQNTNSLIPHDWQISIQ